MSKINKTVTTTLVEQVKSALIIALVVGIGAFYMGTKIQHPVTVDNKVIVTSAVQEAKK